MNTLTLGPTLDNPLAIRSVGSVISLLTVRYAHVMMNILSTPIAKIKNGMTSVEIIVIPIPR